MEFAAPSKGSSSSLDRAVALFQIALTVGMTLIWYASILHVSSDPRFAQWAHANVGRVGETSLRDALTVWLCVGVYRGKWWAFAALSFHLLDRIFRDLYPGGTPLSVVEAGILLYLVVRLASMLRQRVPEKHANAPFSPDRVVSIAMLALNVGTSVSFVVFPLPGSVVTVSYVLWFLHYLPETLFQSWAVYGSRGWAMGTGLVLATIGFFVMLPHPEQRLQRAEAVLAIIYFGLRLTRVGPRPRGFLGIDSP